MTNKARLTIVLSLWWTTAVPFANAPSAATPSAPDQARIEELRQQVDALAQELTRLKGASDPAAQQHGMQRHWSMMQDHMPSDVNPGIYQSQMREPMDRMRSRMAAIAVEQDPAKRDALLREHYETMYREMQSMRGIGWMWAPNATVSLPDRDSSGAKLVASICSRGTRRNHPVLVQTRDRVALNT